MALPIIRQINLQDRQALEEYEAFSCDVPHENPATPDAIRPDRQFVRKFQNISLEMPDGENVEMWVLFDDRQRPHFPGHIIRINEHEVLHTTLEAKKNTHTIHHHGMEPSTFNDGVGHTSFEVTGHYTYQLEGFEPGTYFWHCHKNTVLHFEMGMYGFLIVDPPAGEGTVYRQGEIIPYDVEALWAFDEIDPRFHRLKHDAGLKCVFGQDDGLHNFNPRYFLISGVAHPLTRTDRRIALTAQPGQTIVARVLNAGYTIQKFTFELDVEVIEIDGRPLGKPPRNLYSRPFTIPAGTPFELTSAQRWCLLIRPQREGSFLVRCEFLDWIRRDLLGITETFIHVDRAAAGISAQQPPLGGVPGTPIDPIDQAPGVTPPDAGAHVQ